MMSQSSLRRRLPVLLIAFISVACGMWFALPQPASATNVMDGRFFVRVYNVDDSAAIEVNGKLAAGWVGYRGDSGWKEVTSQVRATRFGTKIRVSCWNGKGGSAWGFKMGRMAPGASAISTIWTIQKGTAGSVSADNRTNTWVVAKTYSLDQLWGNHPQLPVSGSASTGWFGSTYPTHEVGTGMYNYRAVDFNCNTPAWDSDRGKPVYAIQEGYLHIGSNYVSIRHTKSLYLRNGVQIGPKGWYSMYGHLARKSGLAEGQLVAKGALLGTISAKGANNNHLHFAIFRSWNVTDKACAISPYWLPGAYSADRNLYADDAKRPDPTRVPAGLYEDRIFAPMPTR